MKITRHFTREGFSPYADIAFRPAAGAVKNSADSAQAEIIVPTEFSQAAADALIKGCFYPFPLPAKIEKQQEKNIPEWLWRARADKAASPMPPQQSRTLFERDARQVFHRMSGFWTYCGWKNGYFDTERDARAFYDEICFMLAAGRAAPNNAQWRNAGLHWAYGIGAAAQGQFYADAETGEPRPCPSLYEYPALYAYSLQSAGDNLADISGLSDFAAREAQIIAAGSTGGGNISALRGADEANAENSAIPSLLPFLAVSADMAKAAKIYGAAGAAKASGETGFTAAATAVILNIDHPDIEAYIGRKAKEKRQAEALNLGLAVMKRHFAALLAACAVSSVAPLSAGHADANGRDIRQDAEIPAKSALSAAASSAADNADNKALCEAIQAARADFLPDNIIAQIIRFAEAGGTDFALFADNKTFANNDAQGGAADEANTAAAGQAAQAEQRGFTSPIRYAASLSDNFLRAVEKDEIWPLIRRSDGTAHSARPARALWDKIAEAARDSGEPFLQFGSTANNWLTVPAGGSVHACDAQAEYIFLDDSAANTATINLFACFQQGGHFDKAAFIHIIRLWTICCDISVSAGQYITAQTARQTCAYRPIGLSHANFAPLLMALAIPYDSDAGRALCAALTALMSGVSYAVSAEIASELGAFKNYAANAQAMLRVIRNHHRAAYGQKYGYEQLNAAPVPLKAGACPDADLAELARAAWDNALHMGEAYGFRNAHISLLAAAHIGHELMGCTTAAADPYAALTERAQRADGSFAEAVAPAVPLALAKLGYEPNQIAAIISHIEIHGNLAGAPHLREKDYSIFACGGKGGGALSAESRLRMMAAAQAFLSGGIGANIPMQDNAQAEDCARTYMLAWKLGLKACALLPNQTAPLRAFDKIMAERAGADAAAKAALAEAESAAEIAAAALTAEAEAATPSFTEQAMRQMEHFAGRIMRGGGQDREKLPNRRRGYTQRAVIDGHKLYLRTGEFEDGRLGEIFIDMQKEGSAFRAVLNNFAIAVSLGLQYGVPLEKYVEAFAFTKFEPAGLVQGNDNVKKTSSVLDYIFRELAITYLRRYDLAHIDISDISETAIETGRDLQEVKLIPAGWERGSSLKSNITAKIPAAEQSGIAAAAEEKAAADREPAESPVFSASLPAYDSGGAAAPAAYQNAAEAMDAANADRNAANIIIAGGHAAAAAQAEAAQFYAARQEPQASEADSASAFSPFARRNAAGESSRPRKLPEFFPFRKPQNSIPAGNHQDSSAEEADRAARTELRENSRADAGAERANPYRVGGYKTAKASQFADNSAIPPQEKAEIREIAAETKEKTESFEDILERSLIHELFGDISASAQAEAGKARAETGIYVKTENARQKAAAKPSSVSYSAFAAADKTAAPSIHAAERGNTQSADSLAAEKQNIEAGSLSPYSVNPYRVQDMINRNAAALNGKSPKGGAAAEKEDNIVPAAEAEHFKAPLYNMRPADSRLQALMQGYTGDKCPKCGHYSLRQNGSLLECDSCGAVMEMKA